jgi:hypothetical protein
VFVRGGRAGIIAATAIIAAGAVAIATIIAGIVAGIPGVF